MKAKKMRDFSADTNAKVHFRNSQNGIAERMGEMHLLIVAIDPAVPTGIKSVTLDFQDKEEGLQAFNVLAATAKNVHKTYVEDVRQHAKARPQMHQLCK
jgi:hypothetical protein